MKKTDLMMVLGIFITILFLQFSCAAVREYRAEEIPAEIAETLEDASLLGNKHGVVGVECDYCHMESPPYTEVPDDTCLACHGDYGELVASYIDPHNGHVVYSSCGDCHHSHRPSQNQCEGCHYFGLQAP